MGSSSSEKIRGNAEAEISIFIGVRGGGDVRLTRLREDDGAGGNAVALVAVREIPGTTEFESYFELLMKVTKTDVGSGWASDDFEVIVLRRTLYDYVFGKGWYSHIAAL